MGSAWTLNSRNREWIDLGTHREACMVIPETCGAAGGAVSLWVNVSECDYVGGIITTKNAGAGINIVQLPPQFSSKMW